ncbi:MAG: amino acid adenylation domain-containing protein [Leptolyngbya sp. SIO4C5]|nr:amino acid adenylation domain-containing protein [Leptolyngbya sp. SIO4C5]
MSDRPIHAPSHSLAAKRQLLAELLQKQAKNAEVPPPMTVPLSFAQQRLWFLDQLEPGSPTYNIAFQLHLTGTLQIAALTQAFNQIVQRQEALRTAFNTVDGQSVQLILPTLQLAVPLVDLQLLPVAQQTAEVTRLATAAARCPFDLTRAPLLRVTLVRLAADQHVLLLTIHHIISDGWSMQVLFQELAALYGAFSRGQPSPLAPLPVQYADFAVWQRQQLQGALLDQQLAYWRSQLQGALPVLKLPIASPRLADPGSQSAIHQFSLSQELTQALKTLSQRENVTLFMTLLAAFKILLYRYSGQSDILIGSPIANRNRTELEGIIGFFANTLVLRTDLVGNPTVSELLGRIRATALGAYAHQDLPFERLVDELKLPRDLGHNPLFQMLFVLQNTPNSVAQLPELTLDVQENESASAKFDLSLAFSDTPQGLLGRIEYRTQQFDQASIVRLAEHLQVLLTGMVAQPQQPIAALPLLTLSERQTILSTWNNTRVDYPQRCLHRQIERQVEQTPAAIALSFASQHLTYQELNSRANQLAYYLQAHGVLPDTPVGLCFERSLDLVVAILAVLKAGGAYVPLDPSYPSERLAFMLQDSQVPLLLTHSQLVATLPKHSATTICLDQGWPAIAALPTTNPTSAVTPAHLAYIIYTSGSTGQPKGAMNTHGALSNRLQWMQSAYGLTAADCVLQKTPFSFDVSVWEFLWPLMVGARLAIARPEGHKDSAYLAKLIEQQQVTTLHFVPSMLQAFLEAPDLERCVCVRRVICSGEALPVALQERFFERLSAELHNLYGPTEAAIDVTAWQCQPEPELTSVPIGKPIANTQIYLLDPAGQPVPVGVPGELHIGGAGLARGYWQRAALTAEKFVPSPFAQTESGSRLYRTGDLARYRPDGAIEFLGRIDYQVKLRGFRIELGEIEAALAQHPGIQQTVVTLQTTPQGDRLVAYLKADCQPQPSNQTLRTFLSQRLPGYMIPAVFCWLQAFPLTPNGKVNRKALPPPEQSPSETEESITLPRTATEEKLAAIWQQLLGVETVSVNHNFFDLGGHSLLALRLVSHLRESFKLEMPLRQIFDYPCLAALAAQIERLQQLRQLQAPVPGAEADAPTERLSQREEIEL